MGRRLDEADAIILQDHRVQVETMMLTFEEPPEEDEPYWKNPANWRLRWSLFPVFIVGFFVVLFVTVGFGSWIIIHAADIAAVVAVPVMIINEFLPKTELGWIALIGAIVYVIVTRKLDRIIDLLEKKQSDDE